jgi:hypothetical protein
MYLILLVIVRPAVAHGHNIQMVQRLLLLLSSRLLRLTSRTALDAQAHEKGMVVEILVLVLISVYSPSLLLAGARVRHPERVRDSHLLTLTPRRLLPRDTGRVMVTAGIHQLLMLQM